MARLSDLTDDVVVRIAEACHSVRDIAAMAATSRLNYALVRPVLYETDTRERRQSALFWAAEKGILRTAYNSLSYGANPDLYRPDAPEIIVGSGEIMPEAVEPRVENTYTRTYYTALHMAAKFGHNDIVSTLLDFGAHINAWCKNYCRCGRDFPKTTCMQQPRWTVLHLTFCGYKESTAELLIRRGADVTCIGYRIHVDKISTPQSRTQVHLGEFKPKAGSLGRAEVPTEAVFLKTFGVTALHASAAYGMISLFDLILTLEPLVTFASRDLSSSTPLHYASLCWQNPHDVVAWFSQRGANIEALNSQGVGPFLSAIAAGNYKAACAFFCTGSEHTVLTPQGRGPLHLAVESTRKYSNSPWQRNLECKKKYRSLLIKGLALIGADLSTKINRPGQVDHGQTPLCRAAYYKAPRYVYEALLECGVQINTQPHMGRTALHTMLWHQDMADCPGDMGHKWELKMHEISSLKALIELGARLDIQDQEGYSPLQRIISYRNLGFRDNYIFSLLRVVMETADHETLPLGHLNNVTQQARDEKDYDLAGYLYYIWGGLLSNAIQEDEVMINFDMENVEAMASNSFVDTGETLT